MELGKLVMKLDARLIAPKLARALVGIGSRYAGRAYRPKPTGFMGFATRLLKKLR